LQLFLINDIMVLYLLFKNKNMSDRLTESTNNIGVEKIDRDNTRAELTSLSQEVKLEAKFSNDPTFTELKDNMSDKNSIMDKLFNISNLYFEGKLMPMWFTDVEKDRVKLVLWDRLIDNLDVKWIAWIIIWKINWTVRSATNLLSTDGNDSKDGDPQVDEIISELWEIENELWVWKETETTKMLYWSFDDLMWESFVNLKKAKEDNQKFDKINEISAIIYWKESTKANRTFEDIREATMWKMKSFKNIESVWDKTKGLLDKLPTSVKDEITSMLSELVREYPILGIFLSFFLWEWYLEWVESDNKAKDSLASLVSLVKNADVNSPLKKLKIEALEKLTPKSLEKFFKYMENKEIDYKSEDFWKAILTGQTTDEKLIKINEVLKGGTWSVISETWDKANDDLVNKLNNIWKLEDEYNLALEEKKLAWLETSAWTPASPTTTPAPASSTPVAPAVAPELTPTTVPVAATTTPATAPASPTTTPTTTPVPAPISPATVTSVPAIASTPTIQATPIIPATAPVVPVLATPSVAPEIAEQIEASKFKISVMQIRTLPADIYYKWEKKSLNILEDKYILLWDNKYKISIKYNSRDIFNNIRFENGNILINTLVWDEVVSKEKLIWMIPWLIDTDTYTRDIQKNWKTATVKVEKIW